MHEITTTITKQINLKARQCNGLQETREGRGKDEK